MEQNNKRNMVRILVVLLLGFSFIYRKIGFHTCTVFNLYKQAIVNHQPTISDLEFSLRKEIELSLRSDKVSFGVHQHIASLIPFQYGLCFFLFGTLSDVSDHTPLLSNEN